MRRLFTIKLDINTLFTPKATHSPAILLILSAIRFLLTSEFMISLVLICKTTIFVITSVSLKLDECNGGNILLYHQRKFCTTEEGTTAISIVKSTFQVFNIYAFGDTVIKKDFTVRFMLRQQTDLYFKWK